MKKTKLIRAKVTVFPCPLPEAIAARSFFVFRRVRIRALIPKTGLPPVVLVNQRVILQKDWRRKVGDGDSVALIHLPRGGGGGGSNPMRIIASLAIMAAAFYAAPFVGQSVFGFGSVYTAAGAYSLTTNIAMGVMSFAGNMLLNVLMPVKPPEPAVFGGEQASPTYSLSAQGNQVRIGQMIPVQYGRLRVFPDLAAQPYTYFQGNDQYLAQLHCLGNGEFAIEKIQLEDTDIASFTDIEYEVIAPGGALTLFPAAVSTSEEVSGQELLPVVTTTYGQSGTTITVTSTAHNLGVGAHVYLDFTSGGATSGIYVIAGVTDDAFTVYAGSNTTSGGVAYSAFIGPFILNAAETATHRLAFDMVFPRGISGIAAEGDARPATVAFEIWLRTVDDNGAPTGAWTKNATETESAATITPQRRSYAYNVSAARYEAMVRQIADPLWGHNDAISWAGARCFFQETRDFGNVTLLAARMRASNNLSMRSTRRLNVICTRKIPIYDADTKVWSAPTATASIAWAAADMLRNDDYGGALDDSAIDLAGLAALDDTWTARGDECNLRFDSSITVEDALTNILQCGRAKSWPHAGVRIFHRDQAQNVPTAMFTAHNMRDFKVSFALPNDRTTDSVRVTYFDRASWTQRTIVTDHTGAVVTGGNPADLKLMGVTSRTHAHREGAYNAAASRYRREEIAFTTDKIGFQLLPGALIGVSHDMPSWGTSGEVVAYNSGTNVMLLSEQVAFGAGTHYVILRKDDGSQTEPIAVTAGADAFHVVLASDPTITLRDGIGRTRTRFVFGKANEYQMWAIVTTVTPRSEFEVEVAAILENAAVHTADNNLVTPAASETTLPRLFSKPTVSSVFVAPTPNRPELAQVSWTPAEGADYYIVEMSVDGVIWTRVADTTATHIVVPAPSDIVTTFRVAGSGLLRGDWVSARYGAATGGGTGNTDDASFYGIYSDEFYVGTNSDPFYNG